MISVLMSFGRHFKFSVRTAVLFPSPSLAAVFIYLWFRFKNKIKGACEKIHKNPLRRKSKSRYQNASLTVEASVAFPVFLFAVLYLIQMFSVLRAELVIAEAGITSAREVAAYSYAAERLAEGENAAAGKLLELFDRKIVKDVALTGVFYARCDEEVLKQAKVGQGIGGIWVDTQETDDKTYAEIYYKVNPANVLKKENEKYYVMRLAYRNWTGEGGGRNEGGSEAKKDVVYVTKHGTVYHLNKTCSYIKIDINGVLFEQVGEKRNLSGAKYYACEFCLPKSKPGVTVYITEYGTRFHSLSSCSAITRYVEERLLREVKKTHRPCSRCGVAEEDS